VVAVTDCSVLLLEEKEIEGQRGWRMAKFCEVRVINVSGCKRRKRNRQQLERKQHKERYRTSVRVK
jgi:hypothetical protein